MAFNQPEIIDGPAPARRCLNIHDAKARPIDIRTGQRCGRLEDGSRPRAARAR
jgi:hypothetical protein